MALDLISQPEDAVVAQAFGQPMRSATAPSSEHPQPPRRAAAARRPGPNGGGGFAGRATRSGRDPELDPETAPPTEPRAVGRPVVGWLDSRSPSECHQVDFRTRPLGASTRQQGHLLGWPGSRQGRAPPAVRLAKRLGKYPGSFVNGRPRAALWRRLSRGWPQPRDG